MKTLIVYYSKTGTTKQIAEAMGAELENAEVKTIDEAIKFDDYDKVIIGGPINGMNWNESVKAFVKANESELQKKKVAFYAVSYMVDACRSGWNNKIHHFSDGMMKVDANTVFSGRVDKEMPGFARLIFGLEKGMPIDRVDLNHVKQFAEQVKNI